MSARWMKSQSVKKQKHGGVKYIRVSRKIHVEGLGTGVSTRVSD
jgi:hypothetical protein